MAPSLLALLISASQAWSSSTPIQPWDQFQAGDPYIPFAKLSPDHKLLLSMYDDDPRVWDVKTGMLLFVIPGPGKVLPAAFSADNSRLAIADFKRIMVWNVRTGKPVCQLHLNLEEEGCEDVGISPDGSRVYCLTSSNVLVFDSTTGKLDRTLNRRSWRRLAKDSGDGLEGPTPSRDRKREIDIENRDVVIRRAHGGRPIRRIRTGQARLTGTWFINDDSEVLTTARGDGANVWDGKTGRFKRPFGEPFASMEHLVFKNGAMETVSPAGEATLWSLRPLRRLGTARGPSPETTLDSVVSPDGTRTLKFGQPAELEVLGKDGAKFDLSDADDGVFSHDGELLVTQAVGQNSKVRDGRDGHPICELMPKSAQLGPVCFTPDGTRIAAGGSDGRLSIWSAASGRLLQAGPKIGSEIWSICYAPDGRIYGIVDETVVVVDPVTLKPLLKLAQYEDGSWIVLTPDGKFDSSTGSHPKFGHLVVPTVCGPSLIPFSKLDPTRFYTHGLAASVLGTN